MTRHRATIVIGIGSRERGDDAVGLLVAHRLRARENADLRILESDGDATELIDLLSAASRAIIVDAADFGGASGELRRFDVATEAVPQSLASFSSHDFGAAQGIELARALGVLPAYCVVYAIQGECFDTGEPLTAPVRAAIDTVVTRISNEIERSAT